MKKLNLIITAIVAVAIFFRFYNLSNVPPQATVDEASIGYNAYSILKTGADEYGNRFPVLLRAYDDWRPALYVYLVIPFIAIFDLNVLSVRLPSVLLSSMSVIAVYLLLKELFINSKLRLEFKRWKLGIPEIATFFMAISPWHIYISRLGHEVNASFAFFIFGLLFFFKYINKKGRNLYLAALFLALSFDSYQSTKIVVPLVILVLVVLYFRNLVNNKKNLFISIFIGIIVALPILTASLDPNALIRFRGTNLLTTSEDYFTAEKLRLDKDHATNDIVGLIFDNSKISAVKLVSHAYLSHWMRVSI